MNRIKKSFKTKEGSIGGCRAKSSLVSRRYGFYPFVLEHLKDTVFKDALDTACEFDTWLEDIIIYDSRVKDTGCMSNAQPPWMAASVCWCTWFCLVWFVNSIVLVPATL